MALFGAGLGIFASPNMSSIMGSVPSLRRGIASGFRATFFNVGFVISLNLAILVMTLQVPYALISQVIASPNASLTAADKVAFVEGLRSSYLLLAVLNTFAILPSALRGPRARNNGPAVSSLQVGGER
jgi:hypothetical protein